MNSWLLSSRTAGFVAFSEVKIHCSFKSGTTASYPLTLSSFHFNYFSSQAHQSAKLLQNSSKTHTLLWPPSTGKLWFWLLICCGSFKTTGRAGREGRLMGFQSDGCLSSSLTFTKAHCFHLASSHYYYLCQGHRQQVPASDS